MSNPSIRIRFIRANGSAKNDDNVVICRLGARQFNLSYTYGESATKNPHHVVLTDSSVFRWMRNLIGILEKDVDPFEYIQMDLPFMPSVLFDAAKLGDAYHAMLSALEFHLDNWPETVYRTTPVEEEEEEEDDEYDELEEDEYEDMPPLTSIPSPVNQWNNSYLHTGGSQHLFMDEDA